MSSKKKSKRKQAVDIFKEHEGNIDLVEIARLLDSPPGTVRGWKSKDKWDNQLNGTFQEEKRSVPKEKTERSKARGAPKGNQNAIGNDGGAPKGNKNAARASSAASSFPFAERGGFEPPEPTRSSTVFETAPFDHSGISPSFED